MFHLLGSWVVRGLLIAAIICGIVLAFWLAEIVANFVVHVFDCIMQEFKGDWRP
jgi:hypothetical protein